MNQVWVQVAIQALKTYVFFEMYPLHSGIVLLEQKITLKSYTEVMALNYLTTTGPLKTLKC